MIKKEDNRSKKNITSQFNGWVIGIILSNTIFFGIKRIIECQSLFLIDNKLGFIFGGVTIIGIISLFNILYAKKWAVFLWFAYKLSVAIINGYNDPIHGYSFHFLIAAGNILLMYLVLQIKNNGVSAWSVIFDTHQVTETKKDDDATKVETYNKCQSKKKETGIIQSEKDGRQTIKSEFFYNSVQKKSSETAVSIEGQTDNMSMRENKIKLVTQEKQKKIKEPCAKNRKWCLFSLVAFSVLVIVWFAVWVTHRFKEPALGEYVYVDGYSIMHVQCDCDKIADINGTKPVSIYSLKDITKEKWKNICSYCVRDMVYKEVEQHLKENSNSEIIVKDKQNNKNENVVSQKIFPDIHSEKWDAINCRYSNYSYGFGWDLPKEYEWEKVEGLEKHTVFRAEGRPFTVFVNAQVAAKDKDLWAMYGQFIALVEQLDKYHEKKSGLMVYERTYEKCTLAGQHAIKTTFKEYFKDSRYDEPVENYAEEYSLILNGYLLTIALKMPKVVYDAIDCKLAILEVFQGFRYAVKNRL